MTETSRRNLIAGAGVGAVAGTVALATGGAADAATKPHAARAKEPVFVVLDDHTSDKVRLLIGEREVVVHDRELATRILNAAGGK